MLFEAYCHPATKFACYARSVPYQSASLRTPYTVLSRGPEATQALAVSILAQVAIKYTRCCARQSRRASSGNFHDADAP